IWSATASGVAAGAVSAGAAMASAGRAAGGPTAGGAGGCNSPGVPDGRREGPAAGWVEAAGGPASLGGRADDGSAATTARGAGGQARAGWAGVVNPGPSPLVWWTRAATVASRDPGKGSVSAGPSCGAPDAWPDEDAQAPTEEDGAAGDIPASRARRTAKSAGGDDGSRSPFVDGPASEATGEVGRGAGGARGGGI